MYRQGDVLIVQTDEDVGKRKEVPRDNGRVVLAYGEVTGHAHAFSANNVKLFRFNEGGDLGGYLEITDKPADLTHEEHDTITLIPGRYCVIRQREYDAGEARYVAD